MADALVAGVQYGLSSRNSYEQNSLVFVKLTDSAYRAIEEYLRNGDRTKQKPTIQFLNNEGHLSIPSVGPAHNHVFNFSLAPTAQAEEGTFDCLRSQGGRSLHAVGSLSHQMWIQANDDVYETTRHRMAVAEEMSKKNCTRVIKPNTAEIGRKVKLKASAHPSNSASSHQPPPQLPQSLQNSQGHGTHRVPTHPTSLHSRAMTNNHAQKPGNPELMRRPIKERLIHLLAVRPYKKPELLDRIHREGIKERDKRMVTQALSQISTMRDNTYHLIRHMWNDVQEDWPFYSEQDRQMLKWRKPQHLTPPGGSDSGSSGSGQSPSSTHPGSPPSASVPKRTGSSAYIGSNYPDSDAVQSSKRPGYFETADGLQSKRQRISHYRKPPAPTDPGPEKIDRQDRIERQDRQDRIERPERPDRTNNSRNSPTFKRSESPATVTSSQPIGDMFAPSSPQHPNRPSKDLGKIQENTVSASEMPEYVLEFTPIKDTNQRRKYKEVFNQDYNEYKKLHSVVEQVSQRFSSLENELQRTNPGTCDYKRIKRQVWKEYQENLQDTKYHEAKRRFLYLHEKLSHIKKLVADYDASIDY